MANMLALVGLISVFLSLPVPPLFGGIAVLLGAILLYPQRWFLFFDFRCSLILLLCFSNAYFSLIGVEYKSPGMYQHLVYPFVFYICGRLLASINDGGAAFYRALVVTVVIIAAPVYAAVLFDIVQNGLANVARGVVLFGSTDITSPTVLGGRVVGALALASVAFIGGRESLSYRKFILFGIAIVGLIVAARLGSRTLMVVFLCSLVFGAYLTLRGRAAWFVAFLIGLGLAYLYSSISDLVSVLDLLSAFRDRMDSDDFGAGSAGGRTEIWINSINLVFQRPLGWPIAEIGFAHNFLLDLARNGGWVTLLLGLVLQVSLALDGVRLYIAKRECVSVGLVVLLSISLAYMLLFLVEPILDGFYHCFAATMFAWGGMYEISKSPRAH